MTQPAETLRAKLADRSAVVGVVGLGYVGLPLVGAMIDAGFRVLGFDVDPAKVAKIECGEDYIAHLTRGGDSPGGEGYVARLRRGGRFEATTDFARLGEADAVLICVPTPLGGHREPDMSYVERTTADIARSLRPGQLIVLESTTYPTTTRGVMQPMLDASGLRCGTDYFLAYSPEREDPGRKDRSTATIPKVVGGVDEISGELARELFAAAVREVVLVESAEIAEASKLLENIYRAVNIALVNELKVILGHQGIDVWEVIEAAKTKPFGFQAFYPGPGLGGHCIPIDPYYLEWWARRSGDTTRFIELAGEINRQMPGRVVGRVGEALNASGQSLRGASVLVVGVAYKKDVDDIRESPAAEIITRLQEAGAGVGYHDPFVGRFPAMRRYDIDLTSVDLTSDTLRAADAVVIVTDHTGLDYGLVARSARLVVDTRNALASRGLAKHDGTGRGSLTGGGELWTA